jgi:hypothetical protein
VWPAWEMYRQEKKNYLQWLADHGAAENEAEAIQ